MISANYSFAQAPLGELMSYKLILGGDTIKLDRKYGTWWYGIQGGGQLNSYFGDLNANTLGQPENPFNKIMNYSSGSGAGYFIGGLIEWKPRGEKWGAILNVSVFDQRSLNSHSSIKRDSAYKLNANFQHIIISPAAKYHLPIEGLHLTGGLNLEIMMNNSGNQNLRDKNSNIRFGVNFDEPSIGFGASFGIGYDFLIADFNNTSRVLLTPFADVNIRSSIVNDNSSAFYSTSVRFGFAMKIGTDDFLQDTLFYDPTYIPSPQYIATGRNVDGIEFVGFKSIDERPSAKLNVLATNSDVGAEIGEVLVNNTDTTIRVGAQAPAPKPVVDKPKPIAKSREIVVKKGETENFSYSTSASVEVTQEMKNYLAKVAEYLMNNPNARVFITGHSDSRGTLDQTTFRARARAQNIEKYLLKELNIPRSRVTATWKGALFAVATNDTEDGRRQNRRVEILIEE